MRTKLTILAGALIFGASVSQAATSYLLDFNTQSNSSGLVYDGSYAISPYTGTLDNGSPVELYCDDFNDSIQFGQQNLQVYKTALTASSTDLKAQTRYYVDNPSSNSSYPAGLTLYEEMAWLATQMQHAPSSTTDKAIQEAIWQLTDAPGGSTAPNNSSTYHGGVTTGYTGTNSTTAQSAAHWIQDAMSYVAGYNATTATSSWSNSSYYANLVLSDWYVVTAVDSAGCTTGSYSYHGTEGCTPGYAGYGSTTQEFLAYIPGTSGATPPPSGVPEPASFVLIGSGLLAGALLRRRKA